MLQRASARLALGAALVALVLAATAAARTIDRGFGHGGRIYAPLSGRVFLGFDRTGTVFVAGVEREGAPPVVHRYVRDGAPDLAFGDGGVATVPADGYVQALSVRPNGASYVAVAGAPRERGAPPSSRVVRLLPSGEPDPSFGTDGVATVGGLDAYDSAVGPGGEVVLGGVGPFQESSGVDYQSPVLVRLDRSGVPDVTFGGGDGRVDWAPPGQPDPAGNVWRLAVDSRSRVYAAVCWKSSRMIRFTPSGSADRRFGNAGSAPLEACPADIALDPRGGVLFRYLSDLIRRIRPDGSVDSGFLGHHTRGSRAFESRGSRVYFVKARPVRNTTVTGMAVGALRLGDGRLDRSFGRRGWDTIGFGARGTEPSALALGPRRLIALAGLNRLVYSGPAFPTPVALFER